MGFGNIRFQKCVLSGGYREHIWKLSQITQLDHVPLSTDSVTALSASLLALSKHLVDRIDTIWAARRQAVYHPALSRTTEADPVTLKTLQRRRLKLRTITASAPTVFYAVSLGQVPGIYTSWREAKPHFSGHSGGSSNMGTSLYIPYRTRLARRSSGHQQHGGTQRRLSYPGLDLEAAQIPQPSLFTAIQHCL